MFGVVLCRSGLCSEVHCQAIVSFFTKAGFAAVPLRPVTKINFLAGVVKTGVYFGGTWVGKNKLGQS